MKKIFASVWVYSLLCLLLILLYRYQTSIFETSFLGFNLSLWTALVINLFFFIVCILSLKEGKLIPSLGIILCFLSTYSFYKSWTESNYPFLTIFISVPVFLLALNIIQIFNKPLTHEKKI